MILVGFLVILEAKFGDNHLFNPNLSLWVVENGQTEPLSQPKKYQDNT